MSYKKQELLTIRDRLGSPLVFGGVRVAHLFTFFVLCFYICLSYVSNAAGDTWLSILDYPFWTVITNWLLKHPAMKRWLETWTLQVDFGTLAHVSSVRFVVKSKWIRTPRLFLNDCMIVLYLNEYLENNLPYYITFINYAEVHWLYN